LRDLDKKLHELEEKEPLTPRHNTWLKSLRKLKVVPDAEMTSHLVRIAQLNPLREQRAAEAERFCAEHENNDPPFKAAKQLCDMAGLKSTTTAGSSTGTARRPTCSALLPRMWRVSRSPTSCRIRRPAGKTPCRGCAAV
jgi:hypothetical protein